MRGAVLAIALAWAGLAGPALAELKICNDTAVLQSIALGFKGATDWTSKGWWNIEPGDCAVVVSGDLQKRYYYYHADSRADAFRGQDYVFCTRPNAFEIVGDSDCGDRGHQQTEFREIDTGETARSFTLTLVSSQAGGRASAKAPGGTVAPSGARESTQAPSEPPREEALAEEDGSAVFAQGPLRSGRAPGAHGQPFTLAGIFQGCELERGRAYCSFHAGGVKYRSFYNGPTPKEMLYALEELPPGTALRIAGDVVEPSGRARSAVLREVAPEPRDPFAATRAQMQGDWVSTRDANSEITIRGSEIYVRYDGAFRAVRFLRLAESCPGLKGSGPVMLQTSRDQSQPKCFRIAATRPTLELAPVDGGRSLLFRRD